ncbi:hypothetical protein J2810_004572 [Chryseobacterium rhizosphaerae]|uniref:hypothetical protein n=1 Tax=Chryseobacterium rhizosphaerae TaxID=395937 RepID=UPI0028560F69|nr:hypothetical protein [Chryseobacterium rhizosphaerae]MDR6548482.1 hypothetical protein [Chryseobacterium rhizosphaerae]
MEVMYIYKTPFNGQLLNTMHDGAVDFTGERVETPTFDANNYKMGVSITFNNPLNFDQYNAQHGGVLEMTTEDEFFKMLQEWENNNICENFKEITAERWEDLLNCLPPKRWHDYENLNIFFMGECFTGKIYTCCIKDRNTGKYYSALRRINETDEEIKKIYLESIK